VLDVFCNLVRVQDALPERADFIVLQDSIVQRNVRVRFPVFQKRFIPPLDAVYWSIVHDSFSDIYFDFTRDCGFQRFRVRRAFLFPVFSSADFYRIDFAEFIHETREISLLFVRAFSHKLFV
jgi:hypothetical protein